MGRVVTIRRSKTDQTGGRGGILPGCRRRPVEAVNSRTARAGLTSFTR